MYFARLPAPRPLKSRQVPELGRREEAKLTSGLAFSFYGRGFKPGLVHEKKKCFLSFIFFFVLRSGNDSTSPARQLYGGIRAFISEIGAALERRGTESSALRRGRGRIQEKEANAAQGTLTPLETCLVSEIELTRS